MAFTAHNQHRHAAAATPSSANCSATWKSIPTPKKRRCWQARSTESNRAGESSSLSAICRSEQRTTALEVGYSVLTVNVRHFRLIPGVTVVELWTRGRSC